MINAPQHCKRWLQLVASTKVAIAVVLSVTALGLSLQVHGSPRFQHLTTEDGLPQAVVHAITQDTQGFIWLATQSGVARYDGYQFKTFRHDPADLTSISQDWVRQISNDSRGNLWFATDNTGICRTSNNSGDFQCLKHNPNNRNSLASNEVEAMVADANDILWVGGKRGLNKIDINSNQVTTPDIPKLAPRTKIDHLLIDSQGNLWIAADNKQLLRYNTRRTEIRDYSEQINGKPVAALAEDATGDIWVATKYGELFRLAADGSTTLHQNRLDVRLDSGQRFTSLLIDKNGIIWVGTYSNGLLRFDPRSNTFTQFRHDGSGKRGISDNHVISLFQDEGEVIWVGTFNGVNKWNPNLDKFTTYRQGQTGSAGLNSNYVTAFAQQDANQLWVGSHNGINRVDTVSGVIDQISTTNDPISGLNDHRIFALEFDKQGGLWIGTMVGGLNYLAPGASKITQPFADHPSALPTGVTSLLTDQAGTLWIGTFAAGLFSVDGTNQQLTQYLPNDEENSISSPSVLSLLEDSQGGLWIGTNGGGLNHLDLTTQQFAQVNAITSDPNALSSNVIYALHEDSQGDLWIGTDQSGINRWRQSDRQANRNIFQRYGRAQGLPDATIHAILSESTGILWFSTNAGLVRLDPYSDNLTTFTATHGLQDNEFNFAAALKTLNNTMVFGGINGFNLFDPVGITTNLHPPKIALTRFTRGHHDNLLPELNKLTDNTLELKHTDVLISFEFAALDFTDPRKNLYQTRLLGFDSNWSNISSTRQASFTNLAPGDYRFQVRAANSDGVWSARRLNVPFTMLAAPWNTPLARGLYAACAALLLLAIYLNMRQLQSNASAIRNKNQTLRTEIERRRVQERALVAEKQINQQYLDIVEVMILVLEDNGEIVRVNQKGERILGYHQNELLGHNFYDLLIPKESHPSVREHFSAIESFSYFESPIKTSSGDLRTIAWHTTRTSSKIPGTSRIITSGMDMTQLRELERRMSEAQKSEALGNLARGIAHDFNNILSSIMGYTELSLGDLPSTSPVTTNLKRLEASARRARELVESILTFSRHEQHGPENVAPAAVLQEALQLIEPILSNNIELNLEVSTPEALVLANPTQLLQLITNLCTNAHQAMEHSGGVLQVKLDTLVIGSPEPQATSNIEAPVEPGEYVRLVIADTGHGMSTEVQQRIFDPFFSTKSKSQGTGLGLSVVHGIVRQLGGVIRVSSEIGKGSAFTTLLPLSTEAITERPSRTRQLAGSDSVPRGNERILFVDDDLGIANIAEQLLSRSGYLVTLAYNGEEALAELQGNVGLYDLLITDESMPHMTGTDLIRQLRKLSISLPVILISGGGADRSSEGIDCYLQKPYTQQELAEAIRQVIDSDPSEAIDNPGVA